MQDCYAEEVLHRVRREVRAAQARRLYVHEAPAGAVGVRVQDGVAEAYVSEVHAVRGGLSSEGEGEVLIEVAMVGPKSPKERECSNDGVRAVKRRTGQS